VPLPDKVADWHKYGAANREIVIASPEYPAAISIEEAYRLIRIPSFLPREDYPRTFGFGDAFTFHRRRFTDVADAFRGAVLGHFSPSRQQPRQLD
jgi:hypothetical protein